MVGNGDVAFVGVAFVGIAFFGVVVIDFVGVVMDEEVWNVVMLEMHRKKTLLFR